MGDGHEVVEKRATSTTAFIEEEDMDLFGKGKANDAFANSPPDQAVEEHVRLSRMN